jgi:hypothetical protein
MARHWKIAIVCLLVLAIVGLATLPTLLRGVLRLRRGTVTEEQARLELTQPAIATPTDARVQAQLFWASSGAAGSVEPSQVELALSADPVQRAKQLINALITQAPTPTQRTLPADCELLQFYLLPDGTAIADFSEALTMETPSGILSEQMTVDSLVRTLAENVSAIHQLKIIVRGQETDTLAGHLDLTGYFPVVPSAPSAQPVSQSTVATPSAAAAPAPAATNPTTTQTTAAPALPEKAATPSTPVSPTPQAPTAPKPQ